MSSPDMEKALNQLLVQVRVCGWQRCVNVRGAHFLSSRS